MEFLIEQNMSRVLYNMGRSEIQIRTQDQMTTLDEALDEPPPAPDPSPKATVNR